MKELLIWFSAWLPLITITPIINNHLIRLSDFVEFPLIFHFGKKPFGVVSWKRSGWLIWYALLFLPLIGNNPYMISQPARAEDTSTLDRVEYRRKFF